MSDMDEKDRISSFLRRIWRMISTALQEWFPDETFFSGPEGNDSSSPDVRGRNNLPATDLQYGKKISGTTDKNRSEPLPKAGENLPEEAFLPGFQRGSTPVSREEKTVDDPSVLPPEGAFAGEEVERGDPASDLFFSAPEMLVPEISVSEEKTSDRDSRERTVHRRSDPDTDQNVLSGSSAEIRSSSAEKNHDEEGKIRDVLSAIPTPSLPEGISIMTAAEPETVPEDQALNDPSVFPVFSTDVNAGEHIPVSNIGEGDNIYDLRGGKEFVTDHFADRGLVFSVSGSSRKKVGGVSSAREDFVLGISSSAPEEDLKVFSVPEEEEIVFSSVSERGQGTMSTVVGRDMGTVEHDAVDPGNSMEEFSLSYGKRSSSVFSAVDGESTFPASRGYKRVNTPNPGIDIHRFSSVSASGIGYDPGEMTGTVEDPPGDGDKEGDLQETEDLSLYEQALHYLAREARSAEGKGLSGFSHSVKNSVPDMEEEFFPDDLSAIVRHLPEPFLLSGQQLAGQIRAGGTVMTVADHSSVSVPGALFSERGSEISGGELLSERMKESIQVLNKINTCCENLKQIVNEGMNI